MFIERKQKKIFDVGGLNGYSSARETMEKAIQSLIAKPHEVAKVFSYSSRNCPQVFKPPALQWTPSAPSRVSRRREIHDTVQQESRSAHVRICLKSQDQFLSQ
mmetsp:Transcript_21585/g.53243  ORF Transcript_21585/g.53243 Transcript_21585/m.53243 type:complete len:103 (+) Transcript_21585:961-1269(+)